MNNDFYYKMILGIGQKKQKEQDERRAAVKKEEQALKQRHEDYYKTKKKNEEKSKGFSSSKSRGKYTGSSNNFKAHNFAKTGATAHAEQAKNVSKYNLPRYVKGVNRALLNSAGTPYSIVKGKKLMNYTPEEKFYGADKSIANKAGELTGEIFSYSIPYSLAGKTTAKLATKAASSKVGRGIIKTTGKAIGNDKASKLFKGLVSAGIGDATIGTTLNLGNARKEGLKSKELRDDMLLNAALDFGIGGAIEVAPAVKGVLSKIKRKPKKLPGAKKIKKELSRTYKKGDISKIRKYNSINEKEFIDDIKTLNGIKNIDNNTRTVAKRIVEKSKNGLDASQEKKVLSDRINKLKEIENLNIENAPKLATKVKTEPEMQSKILAPKKSPTKSERYQNRYEKKFVADIKEMFGFDEIDKETRALIHDFSEKAKLGKVNSRDKFDLFNQISKMGKINDTSMIDNYGELKKNIKNTTLKVNDNIKKNITDYNDFRKSNFGTLKLSKEGSFEVDSYYEELKEVYPEVFPELNSPEEMLEKISEVAKSIKTESKDLENILGDDLEDYLKETYGKFDAKLKKIEKEAINVKNYEKSKLVEDETDLPNDIDGYIEDIKKLKKYYEDVDYKILLTRKEKKYVQDILDGTRELEYFKDMENYENIAKSYYSKLPYVEKKRNLTKCGEIMKDFNRNRASKFLEGSEFYTDKKNGFRYNVNTPERNFIDVMGKERGEELVKEYISPIHHNEAKSMKMKNAVRDKIKKLDVSTKANYMLKNEIKIKGIDNTKLLSESSLVQLLGEKKITTNDLKEMGAPVEKIENAVKEFKDVYEKLRVEANKVLVRYGYEPIAKRKDYFPHFSEKKPDTVLTKALNKLGMKINTDDLPTEINGLTHTFKPGKTWFGHELSRTGKMTEWDALKGFDLYTEGITNVIHHTGDIQRLRALENEIRFKYSDGEINRQYKEILNSELNSEEKAIAINELQSQLEDAGITHLSNFASWLRNYTDLLANKKPIGDRVLEQNLGRTFYNTTKSLENRVAANMVALNPGSWLTNFIPLVQSPEIKSKDIIRGMAETIQNMAKGDGFAENSTFLINRKGSDVLSKTATEKIANTLSSPMSMIDNFTSESIVRAKYNEGIRKGLSSVEAMAEADRYAADVIADRSKGALPNFFYSKNPITKIFTMYQVEVERTWLRTLKEIPKNEKNIKKVAALYTKFAIGSYLFNEVYETMVGRRPAADPISWLNEYTGDLTGYKIPSFSEIIEGDTEPKEPKGVVGASAGLVKNVAENVPFVGGLIGGGRVPISSAIPNVASVGENALGLMSQEKNKDKALENIGKELSKPLYYIVPPVGGGQAKKMIETGKTLSKGGSFIKDSQGRDQLRFAVDKTPLNTLKGMLFGQYAIGNSKEYIESDFDRLSAKETMAFKELVETGMKPTDVEDYIRELPKTTSQKKEALLSSDLSAGQRNIIGKYLPGKPRDYSNRDNYNYSNLTKDQKKKVDIIIEASGGDKGAAIVIYDIQKKYSSGVEKALALDEYPRKVKEKLGISSNLINAADIMKKAKLTADDYKYVKERCDVNGNGNISIVEATEWLANSGYSREESYALVNALTRCKPENNPFR